MNHSCSSTFNTFLCTSIMLISVSKSSSILLVFQAASHDNDGSIKNDNG